MAKRIQDNRITKLGEYGGVWSFSANGTKTRPILISRYGTWQNCRMSNVNNRRVTSNEQSPHKREQFLQIVCTLPKFGGNTEYLHSRHQHREFPDCVTLGSGLNQLNTLVTVIQQGNLHGSRT